MRRIGIALALALAAVFLAPTLRMPFLGDDTFNNYLDGWIGYDRLSPAAALSQLYVAQNVMGGRFYPIFSGLLFSEFHFIHSVGLIKALVLGAILINAVTLYILMMLVAPRLALPAMVLLPATWQIRFFHDPIVQFSLHMQLALEFVLIGFIGLALFARDGRLRYLGFGAAGYACACLTYEPVYSYAPVLVVLAAVFVRSAHRKALASIAYAIPPVACGAVALWFRALHPLAPNSEHTVHAAFTPVVTTFAIQALGALPLSYRILNPSNAFAGASAHLDGWTIVIGIVAFVAVAVAFAAEPRAVDDLGGRENRVVAFVAATAACCWFASGALVALSPRWQLALVPGLAYTPVYFADTFVAVMLAALGLLVVRALPRSFGTYVVAGIAAAIIATTYRANAHALGRYAPWNMTEPLALDAGLLRGAPEGSIVFLDGSYPANTIFARSPWNPKYFLYYHTGRRFMAMPSSALPAKPGPNAFVVLGSTDGFDQGSVIAGRVAASARTPSGSEPLVTSIERYVREPGRAAVLLTWTSHCGPVAAGALLEGSVSAMTLSYLGPFYAEERQGAERWRWSAGSSTLLIANPTNAARTVHLRFALRPVDASTDVRIDGNGIKTARDVSGDIAVNADLHIAAHGSERIELTSSDAVKMRPPDSRALLFQVRDLRLVEPGC
ncbi:MAG TPA: hypothetical protein VMB20_00490 [Candidatus Acidoferrum sp.]|nr:hypothetical protein [Candidatus Acidoferrum sp.]